MKFVVRSELDNTRTRCFSDLKPMVLNICKYRTLLTRVTLRKQVCFQIFIFLSSSFVGWRGHKGIVHIAHHEQSFLRFHLFVYMFVMLPCWLYKESITTGHGEEANGSATLPDWRSSCSAAMMLLGRFVWARLGQVFLESLE